MTISEEVQEAPVASPETTTATDSPSETPVAEAKPKTTRRRTTKKTEAAADSTENSTASDSAAEAEEKPKRRRTTKKAEATTAEEGAATETAPTEEEKPKRRRVTRKQAEETSGETPVPQPTLDLTTDAPNRRATSVQSAMPSQSEAGPSSPAAVAPRGRVVPEANAPVSIGEAANAGEVSGPSDGAAAATLGADSAPRSDEVAQQPFTPANEVADESGNGPLEPSLPPQVPTLQLMPRGDAASDETSAPEAAGVSDSSETDSEVSDENRDEGGFSRRLSYRDRRALRRDQRRRERFGDEGEVGFENRESRGEVRGDEAPREPGSRENVGRESVGRENVGRENIGREGSREFGNRESGSREHGTRENGSRENVGRESGARELGFGRREGRFERRERGDREFRDRDGRDRESRDRDVRDRGERGDRDGRDRESRDREGRDRDGRGERRREVDLATLEGLNLPELMVVAGEIGVEEPPTDRDALIQRILETQAQAVGAQLKKGILDIGSDGRGFLRVDGYRPAEGDVYVSPTQIKRFGLKPGDEVLGTARSAKENERFAGLLRVEAINGLSPEASRQRKDFEKLTPLFPNDRFRLETDAKNVTARIIDLISPIGKGQRGLIVAPPKAGKTTLLKNIANSVMENNPEALLFVLLIDERPEEVTDISRSVRGEVVASTFDEKPDNHIAVADIVFERAKRLVEQGKDVVVLLDSITRLSRASNLVVSPSGRTMSGGLDPAAMYKPKRHFGAARNIEHGGSLTILATVLIDTGSRMDEYIFEELKGTGNMDLVLDRDLFNQRIFPAIDINKSGTRRDDLLMNTEELAASYHLRRTLAQLDNDKAVNLLIDRLKNTKSNEHFMEVVAKSARNAATTAG